MNDESKSKDNVIFESVTAVTALFGLGLCVSPTFGLAVLGLSVAAAVLIAPRAVFELLRKALFGGMVTSTFRTMMLHRHHGPKLAGFHSHAVSSGLAFSHEVSESNLTEDLNKLD